MDVKVGTPIEYHPYVTDTTPKGLKGRVTAVHEGNPREDSRIGTVDVLLTNGKKEDDQGYQTWTHLNVPLGYAPNKSYVSPLVAAPPVAKPDAPTGAGTLPGQVPHTGQALPKTPAQIAAEQALALASSQGKK